MQHRFRIGESFSNVILEYIYIYIYIYIYKDINKINNDNPDTEITSLQENMVVLENLASSENLAPPAPLRIQPRSPSAFEI